MKRTSSIVMILAASLAAAGCASAPPKCDDTAATGLLGQIFAGQMRKLSSSLLPQDTPDAERQQRKYANYLERMALPVTAAAEVSFSKEESERVCRAKIDMGAFRAASFGSRPLNPDLDKLLGEDVAVEYVIAMLPGQSGQFRVDFKPGRINAYAIEFASGLSRLAEQDTQGFKSTGL